MGNSTHFSSFHRTHKTLMSTLCDCKYSSPTKGAKETYIKNNRRINGKAKGEVKGTLFRERGKKKRVSLYYTEPSLRPLVLLTRVAGPRNFDLGFTG